MSNVFSWYFLVVLLLTSLLAAATSGQSAGRSATATALLSWKTAAGESRSLSEPASPEVCRQFRRLAVSPNDATTTRVTVACE
jgi:hypothetical protein